MEKNRRIIRNRFENFHVALPFERDVVRFVLSMFLCFTFFFSKKEGLIKNNVLKIFENLVIGNGVEDRER